MDNIEPAPSVEDPNENNETSSEKEVLDENCESQEEIEPKPSCNFSIDDNVVEELDEEIISKIKGDAIGNTLFSERFVLKTLLELQNYTDEKLSDEFEKDLCFLWDMTVEKDVVRFLLAQNCLDLFTSIMEITGDERLIEILLGLIGNMSCLLETRQTLCSNPQVMKIILDQLSSDDPLILLQIMRFLYSAIVFENSGDESVWFIHFLNCENFMEKFSFILSSSTSNTLLTSSLEALNGLLAKFTVIEIQPDAREKDSSFCQMFVKEPLINGIIEAFKQIVPEITDSDLNDDTSLMPSQHVSKVMNLFLETNVTLTQYEKQSEIAYKNLLPEFFNCISRILLPLTKQIYLFPINQNHQGVIENVNDIFQSLGDPFNGQCFHQTIKIWHLIEEFNKKKLEETSKSEWDDDDEEEEGNSDNANIVEDISMTILELITRIAFKSTEQEFLDSVKNINSKAIITDLYARIHSTEEEPELKSLSDKLKNCLKTIWHVNVDQNEQGSN